MSNDKSRDAVSGAPFNQRNHQAEVVKSSSAIDAVLWIVALVLLFVAAAANQYLPQYVPAATNIWVRVGVIVGCIIVALGLLYATHQGKGFVRLLRDSRIELRRVTWPTKQETIKTSWQVLVVVIIAALILWAFDYMISWVMKLIIG